MTVREELDLWEVQSAKLTTDEERKAFFDEVGKKLVAKSKEGQQEHLRAFEESLSDLEKRVDAFVKKSAIKVYPKSNDETELLKNLFQKMNIRFELG